MATGTSCISGHIVDAPTDWVLALPVWTTFHSACLSTERTEPDAHVQALALCTSIVYKREGGYCKR